jgi:hypothetical protein
MPIVGDLTQPELGVSKDDIDATQGQDRTLFSPRRNL